MKSWTHFAAAVVFVPSVYRLAASLGDSMPLVTAAAFMAGARAPDWLEVSRWKMGRRFSVIPHRTLTHTWWVWVVVAVAAIVHDRGLISPQTSLILAFCAACLLHVFMDSLTPIGVPVFNPFGRRGRIRLGWFGKDLPFFLACLPVGFYLWRVL